MEQGNVILSANTLKVRDFAFVTALLKVAVWCHMVLISSPRIHCVVFTCPRYLCRRLTQGGEIFTDLYSAEADGSPRV